MYNLCSAQSVKRWFKIRDSKKYKYNLYIIYLYLKFKHHRFYLTVKKLFLTISDKLNHLVKSK